MNISVRVRRKLISNRWWRCA